MEPLLNYKSISAWSMLTVEEWEALQGNKQFTSEQKKRSPLPADWWIMRELHRRCGASQGGQPIMSVHKPCRFSSEGNSILQRYFETIGTSELVVVEHKLSRKDALTLTHGMYLWLQGNMYVALSREEHAAYQIALQDAGFELFQQAYPNKIQREIHASWDNLFHPNCYLVHDPEDNIYLASCRICLEQVSSAEKVFKSEHLHSPSRQSARNEGFYDPAKPAVAAFSRVFLL